MRREHGGSDRRAFRLLLGLAPSALVFERTGAHLLLIEIHDGAVECQRKPRADDEWRGEDGNADQANQRAEAGVDETRELRQGVVRTLQEKAKHKCSSHCAGGEEKKMELSERSYHYSIDRDEDTLDIKLVEESAHSDRSQRGVVTP